MADITVKIDSSDIKEYIDRRIQELMAECEKAQDVLSADTQDVIDACRNHLSPLFAQIINKEDYSITKHFAKEMVERGERNNKVEPNHAFPDEIDLYNFFEKWHGMADMSKIVNGITPYDYRTVHETVGDIVKYLNDYQDYNSVEYFIGKNSYHAIKFNDRGTFLVSEKRYKELKSKKGQ